ncbi:MAG: 50S ribosomal protein L21 [Dehalococcoidia bacterium]
MYAVIRTGGKQYRVEPGQRLQVERLPGDAGSTIELTDVLMLGGNGELTVGTPTVADARVIAKIIEQGRGRKVRVFKYKNKIRYRRLRGHRQLQTVLNIQEILAPGAERSAVAKPVATAPTDEPTTEEPIADEPTADEPTTDEPVADEPTADEPTATKARATKTAAKKTAAKKTTAKKTPAKKTTAKKTATKTTAGKRAAKKTTKKES